MRSTHLIWLTVLNTISNTLWTLSVDRVLFTAAAKKQLSPSGVASLARWQLLKKVHADLTKSRFLHSNMNKNNKDKQAREPSSNSQIGCVHPLEACHLFSLSTAPCDERPAELKDGCRGVYLFWSLSEGVGCCRDTLVPAWTVFRWKETEVVVFFSFTHPNTEMWLSLSSCECEKNSLTIKSQFTPIYSFTFL